MTQWNWYFSNREMTDDEIHQAECWLREQFNEIESRPVHVDGFTVPYKYGWRRWFRMKKRYTVEGWLDQQARIARIKYEKIWEIDK